jgi:hypothetical protein
VELVAHNVVDGHAIDGEQPIAGHDAHARRWGAGHDFVYSTLGFVLSHLG